MKECNLLARPDAAISYAPTQRDRTYVVHVSIRVLAPGDRAERAWSRKDEQETADSVHISWVWPGC